jgi:hypothetical protein
VGKRNQGSYDLEAAIDLSEHHCNSPFLDSVIDLGKN